MADVLDVERSSWSSFLSANEQCDQMSIIFHSWADYTIENLASSIKIAKVSTKV